MSGSPNIQLRTGHRFPSIPLPAIRRFGEPDIPAASIKEITFTHYRRLPSYTGYHEEHCSACLEPEPTTHFCSHHVFHLPCLVTHVYVSSQGLINNIELLRTNHIIDHIYKKTYDHSTYSLTIPEENLPKCPVCRKTDGMVRIEAAVVDRRQGPLKTTVEIGEKPAVPNESLTRRFLGLKIFDNLTTVLTIFEAFLSYVQNSTPALAGRIFAAQRLLIVADVAILARNCFLLYPLIKQKLETIDFNPWYKKNAGKIALAGIAVFSLATICVIYFINKHFQPTTDPQEFLKDIPASDLGSVSCKWSAIPLVLQLAQFVFISRIVSELALAYFSKERFRHLSHAILQIFVLFSISQLHWLDFERTIAHPLKTMPFTVEDGSSKSAAFYQKIVEKVMMKFTILVPRNTSVSGAQSMMQSFYEYSSNLFKNSIWKGYVKGGLYHVDKVKYEIQLPLARLESPYVEKIDTVITSNLGYQGIFTTIPTLTFPQ